MGIDTTEATHDDPFTICGQTLMEVAGLLRIDCAAPVRIAGPAIVDGVRALVDENRRLREMIAVRAGIGEPVVRVAVTLNASHEAEMGMVVTARTGAERELAQFAADAMARNFRGLVPDWDSAQEVGTAVLESQP